MNENLEPSGSEQEPFEETEVKRRNPWIAFILSLLTPGLGQVYNGQLKKGALFLASLFVLLLIASMIDLVHSFNGLVVLVLIQLFLRVYILTDSIRFARSQRNFVPRAYNRWYYHLVIAIGILILFEVFPARTILGVRSFNIATAANMPALLVNDRVVADMKAYESRKPEYGDLVAFNSTEGVWIFRVVGLPGDKIDFDGSFLSVNNKKCGLEIIGEKLVEAWPMKEYIEELPNGFKHRIFLYDGDDLGKREARHLTVPQGAYYLMGDNRDNALDSRFTGPVAGEDILGKFLYTWWGESFDRINVNVSGQ